MTTFLYQLQPDGQLQPLEAGAQSLDQVSRTLPDGIYTTFRTYHTTRVLGLRDHLNRLAESHQLMDDNRPLDLALLRAGLRLAIQHAHLPEARIRITTPYGRPDAFIHVEPLPGFPPEYYTHGVQCQTTRLARENPRAKYTAFIAPAREDKAQADPNVHERIRVDEYDQLLEGLSSNFFAVAEGVLRTADTGVLSGVTRKIVLAVAAGVVAVEARPMTLAELPHMQEAFITSASREVMPVRQIDAITIGDGQPGPITRALAQRYTAYIDQYAVEV